MPPTTASELLQAVTRWATAEPEMLAVALVGSHARDAARADSDIDLVLICREPRRYLSDTAWVTQFGAVERVAVEDYGKLVSLRVWYNGGPEVEYGITDATWAAPPLDPGTARVLADGMRILWEREPLLSRYQP